MLQMHDDSPGVEEAYENLRLIRKMMERSTKHSSLSGRSGLLVGLWAIIGVLVSRFFIFDNLSLGTHGTRLVLLGLVWTAVLAASCLTDFWFNKRLAASVGKTIFSVLGSNILQAAAPGFSAGLVLTIYLLLHGSIGFVWGYWMLSYGMAICAVGLFSVRPVAYLGWAFVGAGALTLFLPPVWGLWMMAVTFGGFHVAYGCYTGFVRDEW